MEAVDIISKPSVVPDSSSRDTSGQGLTLYERSAEASIIISKVGQLCTERQGAAIVAWYVVTHPTNLAARKHKACKALGHMAQAAHNRFEKLPDEYLVDMARWWSGLIPERSEAEWGEAMGKSERTLRNYRRGSVYMSRPGLFQIMNDWLHAGWYALEPHFVDAGIVKAG